MKINKNGRIVIIDDKIGEVRPLFSIFAKNGIPFIYISGDDKEELPCVEANYDCRFLFLDLNLTSVTSEKNVISVIYPLINSLIQNENHPYILIIWSKKDGSYLDQVNELFDKHLSKKKPILQLNLQKADYFTLKEDGSGDYEAVVNCLDKLLDKFISELKKIDSLELLIDYENITNKSISEIFSELFNLTLEDSDRNLALKNIYYKLASAFLGKTLLKDKDSVSKATFDVLNLLLEDSNEKNIYSFYKTEVIEYFEEPATFDIKKVSILNNKLLLGSVSINKLIPGTIFSNINEKVKNDIMRRVFDSNSIIDLYCEKFIINKTLFLDNKGNINAEYQSDFTQYWQGIFLKELSSEANYIELEISPICDFSQDKIVYHRILQGLIIKNNISKFLKKSESLIILPEIFIDGAICNIVFDVRFLKSEPKKYFKDKAPIYRIRHHVLIEVQSKISKHMYRPGLVNL